VPSSTNVSGHTRLISSSFSRTWPLVSTSASSVSKAFRVNGTGFPSANKTFSTGSRRKRPNSKKCFVFSRIIRFRNLSEQFHCACETHRRFCFSLFRSSYMTCIVRPAVEPNKEGAFAWG
jgi:hypothetical protein